MGRAGTFSYCGTLGEWKQGCGMGEAAFGVTHSGVPMRELTGVWEVEWWARALPQRN